MKKLLYLLPVLAILFVACEKEENTTEGNGQENTGTPGSSDNSGNTGNSDPTSTPVGEYVDLGLSVKWASMNVGATKPEEYGDYFAWGETEPYYEPGYAHEYPQSHWKEYIKSYDWQAYKYSYSWFTQLTKYCNNPNHGYQGFTDNYTVLRPEDDAANINNNCSFGTSWHIPTQDEWDELCNKENCSWTWTDMNGISGYKVQSKKPGYTNNWIFLPASGYYFFQEVSGMNYDCYYWSSSLNVSYSVSAYCYRLWEYGIGSETMERNFGLTIRPVFCEYGVTGITLNKESVSIKVGDSESLNAIVTTNRDSAIDEVVWQSSNTSIARVDNDGVITAVSIGTATITARTVQGGHAVSCTVTVIPGAKYVDLGLGVKWATFNVGATKPEEYGDYFAWGEIESKEDYSWTTYKYCEGGYNAITKYCNNSQYGYNGYIDDKTVLDPEDDAATIKWGGDWRMPTRSEMEELGNRDNCTWIWYDEGNTEFNGIVGYKIQSNKPGFTDNWIFLPAAGFYNGNYNNNEGRWGRYWSSTLDNKYTYGAFYNEFSPGTLLMYSNYSRHYGYSVRPVHP